MKRLRIWARHFSLTQQFISLLFGLSLILVLGILTVILPNIRLSAKANLNKIFNNMEWAVKDSIKDNQQLLYLPKGSFAYKKIGSIWLPYSKQEINLANQEGYYQKEVVIEGQVYRLFLDRKVVPTLEKGIGETFNLLNMLILGLFMMGMLIWLSTLILRLNRIRYHMRKVKLNQPSVLKTTHFDEIGAVSEALIEMEKSLSLQSKEKEEMVQNISHDLKTPIATIKSYAEAIQDGVYPYGTLEESVKVIQDHANRLEKKVKSLLLLNRYGYLAEKTYDQVTDMHKLISSVIISVKAIRNDVQFNLKLEEAFFAGDEEPWRNVIANLLDNALRYAKKEINIYLQKQSLKIENDGPCIPEEELKHLFEPYVKGKNGQFGLGLAIVQKVSQSYGYNVRAYNLSQGVGFQIQWKGREKY